MVWKFGMELFIYYSIKKETHIGSQFYQPIEGAVRATEVVSAAARSKGKLCAFLNFP
jgi:hypothetical protein